MRIGLLLLFLCLNFSISFAQIPLDSIVVTANRVGLSPELSGRRVIEIRAEQIQQTPANNIDEVLRSVAGVEIQSRGGFGVQSDFTIRGSGFNGVLVLIDGIRYNDPQTGHFLSDFPIPLHEIAKIEVLQGSASALYGPDAVGGVIQIFTKTVHDSANKGVSAGLGGGAYGYNQGDFNAAIRPKPDWNIGAAFHLARADGQPIYNNLGQPVIRRNRPLKRDFERTSGTIASKYRKGNQAFWGRFGFDQRAFSAFHYYTNFASDSAREATSTLWLQGGWQQKNKDGRQLQILTALKQHQDEYIYNPLTAANIHTNRLWQTDLNFQQIGQKVQLIGGISGRWQGVESNNLGTHADLLANAHAALSLIPNKSVALTIGSGAHYHPTYGFYALPQAQMALHAEKTTFRASVGQSVRTPDYTERYINRRLTQPRGRNYGNPDLSPETALNFDAGIDTQVSTVALQFSVFQRNAKNIIDWSKTTASDTVWLARNILDLRTRGIEISAQTTIQKVNLQLNYNFLDASLENPQNYLFKYALNHAKHLVSLRASRNLFGFQTALQAQYKKPLSTTAKDYFVLDLKTKLPFDWEIIQGNLWAEVRNLFDKSYADIFDAEMPRRGIYAGFNLKF